MSSTNNGGDRWMRRWHPAEEGSPRLVCFPHAGASATYYQSLSAALSPKIEVAVVQYPGRQDRLPEPPIDSIPELADTILEACGSWFDAGPALYGHSMGAALAFEVARRLQRDRGAPPPLLVVSGRRAPTIERDERIHQLPDEGVVDEIKRLGGTDTMLLDDPDMRAMLLPAVRADYKAIETYRCEPGPKLRCPIIAMVGESDPRVPPEEGEPWKEQTEEAFDFHRFDGGHFFISEHPDEVARIISDGVLARAGG